MSIPYDPNSCTYHEGVLTCYGTIITPENVDDVLTENVDFCLPDGTRVISFRDCEYQGEPVQEQPQQFAPTLPATGMDISLLLALGFSAIVAGLGARKVRRAQ